MSELTERNNQCRAVLAYIADHGTISGRDASHELGIERLAARVHDLKEAGYDVRGQMCYKRDQDGKVVKKWKEYWIA